MLMMYGSIQNDTGTGVDLVSPSCCIEIHSRNNCCSYVHEERKLQCVTHVAYIGT